MRKLLSTVTLLSIVFTTHAQYVNMDSLVKAEDRAIKKLYTSTRVRITLIGIPGQVGYGVNLSIANYSKQNIKNAYVWVKAIDTAKRTVGTEMVTMKGILKPGMEYEQEYLTLFYLSPLTVHS